MIMFKKIVISACAVALLAWGAATTAWAQVEFRSDRAVYFTFSQPVALPGVTLAPGKYLFKLLDSRVVRSIVQVYNGDGTKLYATISAIPSQRMDRPNDAEVRFMETAASAPAPIATYWYPGLTTGWEFVYPKDQAMRIAKTTRQPVLTTASTTTSSDQTKSGDLVRVDANGQQVAVTAEANPPASAVAGSVQTGNVDAMPAAAASTSQPASSTSTTAAPSSSSTRTARANSPAPIVAQNDASAPSPSSSRTRLPRTASSTPLVLFAGVVALVLAAGVAMKRRAA